MLYELTRNGLEERHPCGIVFTNKLAPQGCAPRGALSIRLASFLLILLLFLDHLTPRYHIYYVCSITYSMPLLLFFPTSLDHIAPASQCEDANRDEASIASQSEASTVSTDTIGSVSTWLESHPSCSLGYDHVDCPIFFQEQESQLQERGRQDLEEVTQRGRKRTRSWPRDPEQTAIKRQRLNGTSLSMPPSTPVKPRGDEKRVVQGAQDPLSNAQSAGGPYEEAGTYQISNKTMEEMDPEKTPRPMSTRDTRRPQSIIMRSHPILPPPQSPSPSFRAMMLASPQHKDSDSDSDSETRKRAPEEDDSIPSGSPKKSRPSSPSKLSSISDFQFTDTDIRYFPFDTPGYPIPSDMVQLHEEIEDIGLRRAVIPKLLQDQALPDLKRAKDDFYATDMDLFNLPNSPDIQDLLTSHEAVCKIVSSARDCVIMGCPEPTWGSEVVSRVLDLALAGHWRRQDIWYRDITTARVGDPTLYPKDAQGATQSKLVDYTILFNTFRDGPMNEEIHKKIKRDKYNKENPAPNLISINPTKSDYLMHSPLVINAELKKGLISEKKLHLQLAFFVSAHYKRLRQLAPKITLPTLPLLSIQGQAWKFLLACPHEDGSAYILGGLSMGDTSDAPGTYAVLRGVRRLARWTHEVYMPWFKKEILSADMAAAAAA